MRTHWVIRSCLTPVLAPMLLLSSEVRSQDLPATTFPMTVGSRVRLLAPTVAQGRLEGMLVEMSEQSLVVDMGKSRLVSVSRQAITQFEVSRGRHHHALVGMVIGAGVGGALAEVTLGDRNYCEAIVVCRTNHRWEALRLGLVAGGVLGAGVGALIKTDRWSPVPLDRVRVSIAPTRERGVGLSVAIGF